MTSITCHDLDDIPADAHYAIITEMSVHIPGDERSRQFPGHGYPAETRQFLKYVAFTDRGEWLDEISKLAKQPQPPKFKAVQVTPASVQTEVVVNVSTTPHHYTLRCPECGQLAKEVLRDTFATRVCKCGNRWKPEDDLQ